MSQDSEICSSNSILPAQGAVSWYEQILKILDNRRITTVDKSFLSSQKPKIASHNETKLIAGLKFLGLIDKDGNALPLMESLALKGDKRREALENIVRTAYCKLFDELKIDLSNIGSDDLTNIFLADYKMGSPLTANQASMIFASLANKAGIELSDSISKMISSHSELRKSKEGKDTPKKKPKSTESQSSKEEPKEDQIPENVLARFTIKGVGVVDITDKDTFELAKGFLNILAKKLKVSEEN